MEGHFVVWCEWCSPSQGLARCVVHCSMVHYTRGTYARNCGRHALKRRVTPGDTLLARPTTLACVRPCTTRPCEMLRTPMACVLTFDTLHCSISLHVLNTDDHKVPRKFVACAAALLCVVRPPPCCWACELQGRGTLCLAKLPHHFDIRKPLRFFSVLVTLSQPPAAEVRQQMSVSQLLLSPKVRDRHTVGSVSRCQIKS